MATDITVPALGESITEAVVASWLVGDGDYVERDQDIVELETDKVTMPMPSPAAGAISHSVQEGDTVEVGSVIGSIDESAEKPAKSKGAAAKSEGESAPPPPPKQQPGAGTATAPPAAGAKKAQSDDNADKGGEAEQPAEHGGNGAVTGESGSTPLARKLAQEHNVDLASIHGTGPGGRIREHDVLAYVQNRHANGRTAPAPTPGAGAPAGARSRESTRQRMSQLRQRIASRLVEAQQTAAMLTTFNECDMTSVMTARSRLKEQFNEMHGVKLGFMSFFVKAAVSALRTYPDVNAFITHGEKGPEIEHHDYCDIAVAVGTEKGLVVPVVRNCEALGFAEIESGIAELAKKAHDGRLTLEEMQGGTFTISNGGIYGSMMSTPILNPPQSAILGMHNIIRRPVEHPEKQGEIVIRPMMYLALSYDHRLVDGETAVRFLRHIKDCIEDPERMLLGV